MQKKYIRTADGRILDFDKLNEVSKLSIDTAEELIKSADTPWELCDGFVIKENYHVVECYLKKDGWTLDEVIRMPKVGTYEIVGFIETESGLNYVVKLNENGAMKLI